MTFASFRTSLRARLGLILLFLSLGPVLLVTGLTGYLLVSRLDVFSSRLDNAEKVLESDVVGNNLGVDAFDTATEIDNILMRRIADLRHWSEEDLVVQAATYADQAVLTRHWTTLNEADLKVKLSGKLVIPISEPVYKAASSYVFRQAERADSGVVEILVTGNLGYNALLTRSVGRIDQHHEAWWAAAALPEGNGMGIEEASIDPATQLPIVRIALPVVDTKTRTVKGVICALFRFDEIQKTLSQKSVGLKADIRVVNPAGELLVDTLSDNSPQVVFQKRALDGKADALAVQAAPGISGAGSVHVVDRIEGFAHTAGTAYFESKGFPHFAGFGWGVVISQSEKRALQVLDPLRNTTDEFQKLPWLLAGLSGLVMALVVAAAIVTSLYVSRRITSPLIQLSQEARRIQEGDLSTQVKVRSKDEIGVLENAFNTMALGLREREREREVFGRVVSPAVRERLLSGQLALGGELRRVTILFSDIRGFTTMVESMTPDESVAFLNEYLTEMSAAIRPWGGYLNNFIGDAIVVVFGAPLDQVDHERNAVQAALSMRANLRALNERRVQRGKPPIGSGIGIATGHVVAGQIGSLERLQYTVIGDAVNVASRLETLTKDHPEHPILINGETAKALQKYPEIRLKDLGPHRVKGRKEPVGVWAVLGGS